MTRGQVTRMVVLESVLLGAAGGIIGLAAGMVTALAAWLPARRAVRMDLL